jgi:TRAP-type mannitol/chloroaromatic compound transport system substrate-binding protein
VGLSRKLWDGLGTGDRTIIESACLAENNLGFAEFNANNNRALLTLTRRHRVRLQQFKDGIYKEIGTAAGDVLAKAGAADPLSKKVYASFMAFRKQAVAWTRMSDQTYANKRGLVKF